MSEGFVYFIECEGTGYVKIGWAKYGPHSRMKELQTGCPGLLYVRAFFAGTREDEARMHRTFSDLRGRGEWFACILKLADFLNHLDFDGDELGEPREATIEEVAIGLHDCVLVGNWYPDYPVGQSVYDESGDWEPWRDLLEEWFGPLDD